MPDRGGQGFRPRVGPPSRRVRVLLLTAGALVLLFLAFVMFAGFWTDWLWFKSVSYSSVFTTQLWTKAGLFAVFGVAMALVVGLNLWLAHRLRPPLSAMSAEQQSLDRYRMGLAPYRKWALIGVSLLTGVIAGAAASGQWRLWLMWTNKTAFGVKDSQFHLDVSFYAFDLPWYEFVLGFAFSAVIVSLLAALVVHYLYGGVRLQGPGRRASAGAQGHLAVLLGVFVLLKAVAYWLDRYGLAVKTGAYKGVSGWTGLRYVDANAFLPAKTILFFVALICAVLFFLTPVRRTWAPALIGFGLMALSAVLIGGLYPAIVQQFQVKPNEQAKETPYIKQNIDATRQAYGIADSQTAQYAPVASTDAKTVAPDAQTIADIRLLDPNIVSPTFQQIEQQRSYYGFPSTLDVDRYGAQPNAQDTVIGLRELNLSGVQQQNWINDHFKYTHGFGAVSAKGNQVNDKGQPVFTESGLPTTGTLGDYQQRIYYGEKTDTYSIVGGTNQEIDYTSDSGDQTYQYQGGSGVSLNNPVTRAAYALKFAEPQILYSSAITNGAKVLYDRTPKERVEKVAPWLAIDGDPYPVVENGHLTWVLDGYTTSDGYPFSSKTTLGDATKDSLTDERGQVLSASNEVNYIRNSVKATVDAYTGQVTLYQWDSSDPVLKTWMKAFPGTVEPESAIPATLLPHLRYPQDLFKVQRDLLGMYHMTDPNSFFNGTDIWQVPVDPTNDTGQAQPPYYLTVRMPDQVAGAGNFSLTTTFVPSGRDNLAAFMAVDSDPGPDYGKIRILKVPSDSKTLGPKLVQSQFNSNPVVANQLTLLKNGSDSDLEYGNLLTLPVGGGFLNVEPVYVKGRGANYPVLQKVLAVYGNDNVAFENSLSDALAKVLGGASGATGTAPSNPSGGGTTPPATGGTASPALQQDLAAAQKAFTDGQNALKNGDWTAYGTAQQALQNALNAAAAEEQHPSPSPTPSPTPSP
ncbi:uncharacterized membrane protein (UPF0182 family) [Kitasatospora sp. MAA4]|uniref:UPF0182 family membrane protein n=1 Tax=Kitasatospora sp. MAA4 TaxID=3035093 RepID=UPI002476B09E|nr:UPF0182 family protein [Kitasatospora sp. MAA4]MDH6135133.1 uncharacterized membrane protein (UPF0182 family) [Kitasatospora sp. MAA4]